MKTLANLPHNLRKQRTLLKEGLYELLWPARCCVCDMPETYLCERCERDLPYVDLWQACPTCGAPFGQLVCTECNSFILKERGVERIPFDGCVSVAQFNGAARRLITVYKDSHEGELAPEIARLLAQCIMPAWLDESVLTYIPASKNALRRRGFDHMERVAQELSKRTGLTCMQLFAPWNSRDQRGLDAKARMANMRKVLRVMEGVEVPERVIVLDDVLTTGATMFAATDALKAAGAKKVYALTLLRV